MSIPRHHLVEVPHEEVVKEGSNEPVHVSRQGSRTYDAADERAHVGGMAKMDDGHPCIRATMDMRAASNREREGVL